MKKSDRDTEELRQTDSQQSPLFSRQDYRRLRRNVILATATVSLVPLIIMTVINYQQFEHSLKDETSQGILRLLTNNKRSLEFFLEERRSALKYIIREQNFSELSDPRILGKIIRDMNASFGLGSFIDLGLVDHKGDQICYKGPYELQGRNYREQSWFHHVSRTGLHTSEVFLGFREFPHFSVATRLKRQEDDDFYILRATFDAEMLQAQIHTGGLTLQDDIFLINRNRVLQTPSRRYGSALKIVPIDVPIYLPEVQISYQKDKKGQSILVGFAKIDHSPFMLAFVKPNPHGIGSGSLIKLLAFLGISALLIFAVIRWGARQFINSIRSANMRQASLMHKIEYNNKLASIGRLAAGVAHEINNPLAIINEKAGLLSDIIKTQDQLPYKDKYLTIISSVLKSVERCKKITHRLLGFAKHMDIQHELIDLPTLLKEVVGFLGKEAEHRNIQLNIHHDPDIPMVESDRGQLQQVFLNMINNAVGAVDDGGCINITINKMPDNQVSITVADNGIGIPKRNLERIFEPFFTTKEGSGTGLGLSITYGIVQKLGGKIRVQSEVGQGTEFIVNLPHKRGE